MQELVQSATFGVPVVLLIYFFVRRNINRSEFEFLEMQRITLDHDDVINDGTMTVDMHNHAKLSVTFEGLIRSYKPEYFFLEPIDWIRKVIYTGLLIFVFPLQIEQLFVGILLSFFFFAMHVRLQPFQKPVHNLLKTVEEASVFLIFLISLMLKTQEAMKDREHGHFVIYDRMLVAMLMVMLTIFFGHVLSAAVIVCRTKKTVNALSSTLNQDGQGDQTEFEMRGENFESEDDVHWMTFDPTAQLEDDDDLLTDRPVAVSIRQDAPLDDPLAPASAEGQDEPDNSYDDLDVEQASRPSRFHRYKSRAASNGISTSTKPTMISRVPLVTDPEPCITQPLCSVTSPARFGLTVAPSSASSVPPPSNPAPGSLTKMLNESRKPSRCIATLSLPSTCFSFSPPPSGAAPPAV